MLSEADAKRLELLADDGQLQAVVDAWQSLPDAMRAGIAAMVASCQPKAQGQSRNVLQPN